MDCDYCKDGFVAGEAIKFMAPHAPNQHMPKVDPPQCMCENGKPGNVIFVKDGLKCTDCGRDFKYVKELPGKSVSQELLKAAEILEKKAVELNIPDHGNIHWTLIQVAKALRGESEGKISPKVEVVDPHRLTEENIL